MATANMAMANETAPGDRKTLARRYFGEWLNGDQPGVTATNFVAADYVIHFPQTPPDMPQGPDGENLLRGLFRQAFPGFQVIVEDVLADGDKVTARWRFVGTHGGDFMGLPATGRPVDVGGLNIFRYQGDKIAENWVNIDMLSLMQQVGAIPAPGQQPAPSGA